MTGITGLIGTGIQARREHQGWVLDHRYEAFVRAFAPIEAFDLNRHKSVNAKRERSAFEDPDLQALLAQADDLYTKVAEAVAPTIVPSPEDVSRHVHDMQAAYEAGDDIALGKAEMAFMASARKALKIRG